MRFTTMNNLFFQHPHQHIDPRSVGSSRRANFSIPGYQGHTPQDWDHQNAVTLLKWNGKLVEDTRFDIPGYTGFRPKELRCNTGLPRVASDRTTNGRVYGYYSDRIH